MEGSDVLYTVIFTMLLIALLIGGVIATVFLSHRRAEKSRQEIAQMELDYQKELRAIESEVQEATLSHVAGELHDNIGQLLTFMRLQLEKEKLRHPESLTSLEPIFDTLKSTMQQVRLLSHSLSNDFIADGGLQQAIGQEAERLQGLGRFTVHFQTDGVEPDLSRDARIIAFRIFQEALGNSLRHAQAKQLNISLRGGNGFLLQLEDNGKGFDLRQAMINQNGLGLKNMYRRAHMAGFQCDLVSAPGTGCIFTLNAASDSPAA
jgi:two-component system NarL family sensor kinase